ncbi:ComEC/Rec2 family competence protein [Streptomyces sp. NBC_00140]|uniref:ComEC/Rec2 family competence protein n=1 Tax=Streptomyces sp. NBC_00140 TaxID=2975664 RepID=UPI0022558958|nr:ComEC/Rec2 family competence protein [Streptomyces sp. NBC_00140]MCX5334156.1 ComEC/Rec2 family competence protein [Streptomyces sp. NBC_00140]
MSHVPEGPPSSPSPPATPRPRRAVHAASGKRLGDANPRQEGPADLRLVPPALAAWATAALMLDAAPGWVTGVAVLCLVAAGVMLLTRRRAGPRVSVAAVLLCVAAAAVSAGLHGADLRRGPVPGLAREYATVTAEIEVTSDPRLTRPRVKGDRMAPTSVLIKGEVRRVEKAGGAAVDTRAPVLVMVDVTGFGRSADGGAGASTAGSDGRGAPSAVARGGEGGVGSSGGAMSGGGSAFGPTGGGGFADGSAGGSPFVGGAAGGGGSLVGGPESSPWLRLLPSTRFRVSARLAPVMVGGDRVAAVVRVRGQGVPEVVAGPSGVQRFAGRLRGGLREATDGLPGDARALLPGLVVGDTSRITPDLDEAFKETDLAHTLAVSGSNLTIILALLIGPPGLAQRVERRGLAPRLGIPLRTTALLGGALTLAFVVVCRPDPSVLRAAACGTVVLLALATGRRRSLIPALATAVLLLVLYDPWLARSYGFLLSVLATGALLTLAPRWSAALRRRRVPPRLAEALAAAGAAQALCAPVVAVLSARVSLVAVPCNLLVEFAVAPATVLGFAALATAPLVMPVAKALAWCASWPAGWIADVARTGASLPGAGMDWPGSWTGAALLALVTVAVVTAGRRLLRHPGWCGVCGALLLLVVVQPPPLARVITGWPPPGWRFVMCDVGQGDATVLAAGDGTGVVVDAGPDPTLVDRCLRTLGITRIPLVVLTHFHADHVAGLPGVLRGRSVGAIETTGFEEPADQVEFVRRQAARHRTPLTRAVAGERRRTGALAWEVVWPPPAGGAPGAPAFSTEPEGPNDASVALLVRSGGLRFLLLGDLEPPAQRALLRSPAGALLGDVDVLKVAHHGSAYQDPELIRRVAPRLALISVGRDNTYGHPAPGTVAALRAQGAMVLRTDEDGALAVLGTGASLRVAGD